jgi:ubiquinone/menaquinone biosynthesis C-methylase UbiE
MAANYDNSAWFYDRLSRVVYGRALIRSQVYLLDHIPEGSKVLIVGGGTGWILEEIARLRPSGLKITYVEISAKMMALSRKRDAGGNEVAFINDAVEHAQLKAEYNIVITPFLFDNFTDETLQKVFAQIQAALKPGALWLNADFHVSGKWWQKVLLPSMLLFFRVTCRIEAKKLPDIDGVFERHQYKILQQKSFFGEFIVARVYGS